MHAQKIKNNEPHPKHMALVTEKRLKEKHSRVEEMVSISHIFETAMCRVNFLSSIIFDYIHMFVLTPR